MVTYFSFMVPLQLLSSTVHGFLSLQLGVLVWGISPSLPTMSGYVFGYTSLPTSSLHQCFPSNFTLVCSPLSALTEVLLFPSSRHSAAQQAPAPLQGPDHSALICFPNLSLSGISAVTQKQLSTWIICLFLSPLLFSSVYFLYLSISLPLLDLFLAVILRCDGWPTEPTLSALAGSCCDCV